MKSLSLITLIIIFSFVFASCDDANDDAGAVDAGTDTDSDSDTDTDTNTSSDSDTDTDTETESDTNTDTETGDDKYEWHTFLGSLSNDNSTSIATDGAGNIFISGLSQKTWNGPNGESPLNPHTANSDSPGNGDIFILKLNSDGAYQWHTFYGGLAFDSGSSIALGEIGNIYVTGNSLAPWDGPEGQSPLHPHSSSGVETSEDNFEIVVLKLDGSGAYEWHTFYGSLNVDYSTSLDVDENGDLSLTGYSLDSWYGPDGQSALHDHVQGYDIYVLRLASNGDYQWHGFYGGAENETSTSVAVDGFGNIYTTGYSTFAWTGPEGESPQDEFPAGGGYIHILKLDSNGAYQWHTFSGRGYSWGLIVDSTGDVNVTGESTAPWNGPQGEAPLNPFYNDLETEAVVLKISAEGEYQWHTFLGTENPESGSALAGDENGNIFVTGGSWDPGDGPADLWVLKLNSSGEHQWDAFLGGQGDDVGRGISVDNSGHIFISGYSDVSWTGPDGQEPLLPFSGTGMTNDILVIKLNDTDGDGP